MKHYRLITKRDIRDNLLRKSMVVLFGLMLGLITIVLVINLIVQ